jgi:hypothetical protein
MISQFIGKISKTFLLVLTVLIIALPINAVIASSDPDRVDLGVTYDAKLELIFEEIDEIYVNVSIKRFFLNNLKYSFQITGEIIYDETIEMYQLGILGDQSKIIESPYSSIPISLVEIYGVIKVFMGDDSDGFTISLLYDEENTDPIPLEPTIIDLPLPINLPTEAIIYEDQLENNFGELTYDSFERIVYLPFGKVNETFVNDNIKYEIVLEQGSVAIIQTLFLNTYALLGDDYRLVIEEDESGNEIAKILRRVSLLDRFPDYFDGISFELAITELAGLALKDTTGIQITMSGNVPEENAEALISFIAFNADFPTEEAMPQIMIFQADNSKEQINFSDYTPVKAPPLSLSWNVSSNLDILIKVYNQNEVIYEGPNTFIQDFNIDNFSLGDYFLTAQNKLGSKMAKLEIIEPEDDIQLQMVDEVSLDGFTTQTRYTTLGNEIFFTEDYRTYDLAIDVIGNPPKTMIFLPTDFNTNRSVLIENLFQEDLYSGYLKRHYLRVTQIKSDYSDTVISFAIENLSKDLKLNLASKLGEDYFVIPKQDFLELIPVGSGDDWMELFFNTDSDFLILKPEVTPEDLAFLNDPFFVNNIFLESKEPQDNDGEVLGIIKTNDQTTISKNLEEFSVMKVTAISLFAILALSPIYFLIRKK